MEQILRLIDPPCDMICGNWKEYIDLILNFLYYENNYIKI